MWRYPLAYINLHNIAAVYLILRWTEYVAFVGTWEMYILSWSTRDLRGEYTCYIVGQDCGIGCWDSVVVIVTGLWAGQFVVWFPAKARDYCLLQSVQTDSGAHPVSCSVGIRVSFTVCKVDGVWSWQPLPSSAKVKNELCYTFTHPVCLHSVHRA